MKGAEECLLFAALITRLLIAEAYPVSDYHTIPMSSEGGRKADVDMRMVGFDMNVNGNMLHVNGHVAWLSNPRNHWTISPPIPGGCGTFERVSDIAKDHNPKCRYATNAGMFNVHTKECFGNIVSDGKVVQTVPLNETNVAFGVKNGEFVIGYVSPEDIAAGGFQELVNGLGWLVRDGSNYVNRSWKEAYAGVQTSGSGWTYPNMRSGRTAIGHDGQGRLVIFQVDGDARGVHSYGMTLSEVADHLIKYFNVTNAIALDSGGSTSFAKDGQFINYPSDQKPPSCPQLPPFECERPTSTAICIFDIEDPLDSVVVFASMGYIAAIAGGSVLGGLAVFCFLTKGLKSMKKRGVANFDSDSSDSELSGA